MQSDLREYIRELIKKELEEASVTGNIPGYQTPNAFGDKEMKIKIVEVSDEIAPLVTKFGDRVKVNKVLVTIKHLKTQKVEEAEFDIEAIERELMEKRHYTSTNRWIPTKEIKNGYVTNTRHTILITDAASLDYIVF